MNLDSEDMLTVLLVFLVKGAGWLVCCGLLRAVLKRRAPSWRLALSALTLLSAASLLPAFWTWTLPPPVPAVEIPANPRQMAPPAESKPDASASPSLHPVTAPEAAPAPGRPWREWLLLLWLGGTGGLACWLLTGFLTARRWARAAQPLTDSGWQESLAEACGDRPPRRAPHLLLSSRVPGPCVTGCLRPAILLPPESLTWDRETRSIVLRHELAHLRRGDPLHAWVRALALLTHWINPLVWFAVSRDRHEAELAADDAVLSAGITADRYAATLLLIARSRPFHTLTPLVTAMAHSTTLESRLRRLLSPRPAPQSPLRFTGAGIGLTLLAAGFLGCGTVQREGRDSNDQSLPGAVTPISPIDGKELQTLFDAPASKANKFQVLLRILDSKGTVLPVTDPLSGFSSPGNRRTFLHTLTLRTGQKGNVESIREFPYPTEFHPPQMAPFTSVAPSPAGGSFPVTPTTPQSFALRNIGLEVSGIIVEPKGAFLMVSGTFRETSFDGFIQNPGEAFSPITTKGTNSFGREETVVLTDNKALAPCFSVRETPFIVAALPGKPYRLRLNLKQPDAFLEITCTPEPGTSVR